MKNKILLLLFLILISNNVSSATISGTTFEWYSLEPLDNVIIEINTTPNQTIVTEKGNYSLNVEEGNYLLKAQYFENSKLIYETEEKITIENEGDFIVDLLLFPTINEEEYLIDDFNDTIFSPEEIIIEEEPPQTFEEIIAGLVLLVIAIALVFYGARKITKATINLETKHIGIEEKYFEIPKEFSKNTEKKEKKISNKKKEGKKTSKKETKETKNMNKELKDVLEILKTHGGRLTQKELREKVTFGEAKTSLIVAELEELGKVKKFEKGRGNIIILK